LAVEKQWVSSASPGALGLGLIIGWWLVLIAIGSLIISIMGLVLEYEKPSNSVH